MPPLLLIPVREELAVKCWIMHIILGVLGTLYGVSASLHRLFAIPSLPIHPPLSPSVLTTPALRFPTIEEWEASLDPNHATAANFPMPLVYKIRLCNEELRVLYYDAVHPNLEKTLGDHSVNFSDVNLRNWRRYRSEPGVEIFVIEAEGDNTAAGRRPRARFGISAWKRAPEILNRTCRSRYGIRRKRTAIAGVVRVILEILEDTSMDIWVEFGAGQAFG